MDVRYWRKEGETRMKAAFKALEVIISGSEKRNRNTYHNQEHAYPFQAPDSRLWQGHDG